MYVCSYKSWSPKVFFGGGWHNYWLVFFFYWKIAALQCVDFCHTSTWINHRYTYVPSLLTLPPTAPASIPHSRLSTEHQVELLCYIANSHWLSILHMVIYASVLLPQFIPPSPFPTVSTSLLSMSAALLLLDSANRSSAMVLWQGLCTQQPS